MVEERERATRPEDITRLVVERMNAEDAEGIAALYEPDAVLAFPPGQLTVGRESIRGCTNTFSPRAFASSWRNRCPRSFSATSPSPPPPRRTKQALGHRSRAVSPMEPGWGSSTARTSGLKQPVVCRHIARWFGLRS